MLARLMLKLGPREEARPTAQVAASTAQAVANVPAAAPRARVLDGRSAATLQIDDGFERTWRRVGMALDRGGFTLEDRDRNQGLYFVRYVDPKLAGKEEPNVFQRLFGAKKEDLGGKRYRLKISTTGGTSLLEVLNADGQPLADDSARSIVQLLLPELR
jgi:outer membrane protein assembly factor BamC